MKVPLLLLIGGAGLAAAPFSHRLHLGLKLECTACHAAALTSTRPQDNLLPSKSACRSCHQDRTIPDPFTTRVAQFNHSLHLKMGNVAPLIASAIDRGKYLQPVGDIRRHLNSANACFACHRGIPESEQVAKANMPQMADCLVCHVKIENPYSCETCHLKGMELRPENHLVGSFIDIHSDRAKVPDKTGCAVCHGRQFTCMGCH